MEIDRILYPIEALGPGKRLVIWTIGCSKHCQSCANEELWEKDNSRNITVDEIVQYIKSAVGSEIVDGITFTGGDPLEQAMDTLELAAKLKTISDDILVYTGYTIEEIDCLFPEEKKTKLQSTISVLIEGRYIDSLNDNKTALRGSTNQRILFFDENKKNKYQSYIAEGRRIQNVFTGERVISVGIHNRDK